MQSGLWYRLSSSGGAYREDAAHDDRRHLSANRVIAAAYSRRPSDHVAEVLTTTTVQHLGGPSPSTPARDECVGWRADPSHAGAHAFDVLIGPVSDGLQRLPKEIDAGGSPASLGPIAQAA